MAVVGEAKIIVRALTSGFKKDVENASRGVGNVGERAGRDYGKGVNRGFSQSIGGFTERNLDIFEVSRRQFRKLSIATNILLPAIAGLVGIIGNLVSGLVILVAAAGSAAKALGIGLLGAITAVAQAGITLGLAFKGFGKAMEAAKGGSNAAANAARAEEAALRRLRDARLNLKRIIEEEAPEALAAARERAAAAADAAAAAVRSQERAQRAYVDAQKESFDAQEDLNKAREEAVEKLQQLRFELEGAAIGEKRARLEFEKARDSLQAVQDLPPNSRARQEAELAFAQAELNLRKAIDNNSDLKREEDAATKAGVEGSEGVVRAKERIARATQAETDAAIDAALAVKAAAKAQVEAARAAADASAGGRVERELQRRIAVAREQVRDAERAAEDARRSASSAADQFAFTDAQFKFAQFIRSLAPAFFRLREAAGDNLFPQLETALGTIVTKLFPTLEKLLEGTSDTLGKLAINFSEVITEGENVRRLESVWTTNDGLLTSLGAAAGNLYSAFLILLEAAEPVIKAFGDWAESSSAEFLARLAGDTDEVSRKFERNLEIFQQLARITEDLKEIFGGLGDAINVEGGGTDILLGFIEDITTKWSTFVNSDEGQSFLQEFFKDSATNFTELLTLVGLIAKGFLNLGASEGIGDLLRSLQNITITFNELGQQLADTGALTAFGEAGEAFAELFVTLTESGAITIFFETLRDLFNLLNDIFGSEIGQAILRFVAPILAVALAFGSVFRSLRFAGRAFIGFFNLIKGGFRIVGRFFGAFLKGPAGVAKAGTVLGRFGQTIAFGLRRALDGVRLALMNLGPKILPALKGLGAKIGPLFGKLGEAIGKVFARIAPNALAALKGLGAKIGPFLGKLLGGLGPKLLGLLAKIGPWILRGVGAIIGGIPGLIIAAIVAIGLLIWNFRDEIWAGIKAIGQFFVDLYNWIIGNSIIPDLVNGIIEWMANLFTSWIDAVKNGIAAIVTFFQELPGKLAEFGSMVWSWIKEAWDNYWAAQQLLFGALIDWVASIPGKLKAGASRIWEWIKEAWDDYWAAQQLLFGALIEWVKSIPGKLKAGAGKIWGWIREAWDAYWTYQKNRLDALIDWFKNLPSKLANAAGNLWNWLKDSFKTALNWVIDRWNNWKLSIRIPENFATRALGIAGWGFDWETPNIPRLAMGGVVSPRGGGTLAMIAEAGRSERVEPLDASGLSKRDRAMIQMLSGGGGATINVYPSPGMDERELADMVSRRLAYQMRRGAV